MRRRRAFGEAMRPCWVESGHPLPKTPRQKWIETKESWERSRHIEMPARIPAAPPGPGGRRVAFLTYRGNPRCGGQGVYTRHLTRELVALGHSVEVFSGAPWPELDEGVGFTPVPGLDLYRDPDPFRVPHPREFHSREDWKEFAIMMVSEGSWRASASELTLQSFKKAFQLFSCKEALTVGIHPGLWGIACWNGTGSRPA